MSVIAFYIAAVIAVVTTLLVITRKNAVQALLYLAVSLISVAVIFYDLGAPFMAALEVIVYAGSIIVLFIFVVMMLNLGKRATAGVRGGALVAFEPEDQRHHVRDVSIVIDDQDAMALRPRGRH